MNVYFIYEICKWLTAISNSFKEKPHTKIITLIVKAIKIIYACLWSFSLASVYIAFLMPAHLNRVDSPVLFSIKRMLKMLGNYHLGLTIYMAMALLVVLVCRLIEILFCKRRQKNINKDSKLFNVRRSVLGIIYVTFIVAITMIGVKNASDIKTNRYDITVNKSGNGLDELKVVMVADLHLGYNIGCKQMASMVSLINEEKPDLVVIAGDIFDNEYEALDDPDRLAEILSSIESRYGTYAVYGNHDVSEKIIGGFTFNWHEPLKGSSDEMDEFIRRCGFTLLMDDYVLIDDSFYLYGRPDYEKPGKTLLTRKPPVEIAAMLDMSKPVIVIDHEPRELAELSTVGIDVDLCGHTHDGQFFPMNITCRLFTWENSAGLLEKGNMKNIVTSGVGLFGPNIRIGTQAEICPITIHFGE